MKAKLIEKFVSIYGEGGEIRSFFSPGRVNLNRTAYRLQRRTRFPMCTEHRNLHDRPQT